MELLIYSGTAFCCMGIMYKYTVLDVKKYKKKIGYTDLENYIQRFGNI